MSGVLVIRQKEEAIMLAKALREKGIIPYVFPLFKVNFLPLPPVENPQGIIITSKNALRSLRQREDFYALPLYTVGDKTAEFAKSLGFLNVLSASGDSRDLLKLILKKASPEKGPLLYFSGTIVKGNITEGLLKATFDLRRHIVYEIHPRKNLPFTLKKALVQQEISHILFFSPYTTILFLELLKKENLEIITQNMTSLCLSQDVVKETLSFIWRDVWVSPHPTVDALTGYFDEK